MDKLDMDWNSMMVKIFEARVDLEKYDLTSTVIIVPFEWKDHIKRFIEKNNKYIQIDDGNLTLWGTYLAFGFVDKPIAGTYSWRVDNVKR